MQVTWTNLVTLVLSCALVSLGCERKKTDQRTSGFSASPGWIGPAGKPLAQAPFRRTKDGFGAALYLITDAGFFDRWDSPTAGPTYNVNPVAELRRNQVFYTVVLFANALADADGGSRVSVDMTVFRPDGTVYALIPNMSGTKAARGPNDLKLAANFLKIKIEDKDPLGEYRVRAVVHDRIRGASIPLETGILIVESSDK